MKTLAQQIGEAVSGFTSAVAETTAPATAKAEEAVTSSSMATITARGSLTSALKVGLKKFYGKREECHDLLGIAFEIPESAEVNQSSLESFKHYLAVHARSERRRLHRKFNAMDDFP